jgi:hypothetical protein
MLLLTGFGKGPSYAARAEGSSAAYTTISEVTARVRQTYSLRSPVT